MQFPNFQDPVLTHMASTTSCDTTKWLQKPQSLSLLAMATDIIYENFRDFESFGNFTLFRTIKKSRQCNKLLSLKRQQS